MIVMWMGTTVTTIATDSEDEERESAVKLK